MKHEIEEDDVDLSDKRWWIGGLFLALVGAFFLWGPSCEETRQSVDAVADEVTGNRALRQGEELKGQIRDIGRQHAADIEAVQPR